MHVDVNVVVNKIQEHIKQQVKSNDPQFDAMAVFQEQNAEILQHLPEIQQVIDLWHDKFSTTQYINFLSYNMAKVVSLDLARELYSNMTLQLMDEATRNLVKIVQSHGLTIPQVTALAINKQAVIEDIVCTFALQQYIQPKKVDLNQGDVFIDCGAYNGVTTMWAMQKGAEVYSFEPIPENFAITQENLLNNGYSTDRCFCLGVGAKNEQVTFKMPIEVGASAFAVSDHLNPYQQRLIQIASIKDVIVDCVRLDDFCKEHEVTPTFIKMDVEGSELEALQGSAETIKTLKPKLAICLYHQTADLWTIPLYLKSLVPEYKFFCRENNTGFEFVLYATVEAIS